MIIHNASFMIEREREPELTDWLRAEIGSIAFGDSKAPADPKLSAMREAGGVDYRKAEAQTVAFQVMFRTIEEARSWSKTVFADIAARFEEKFAPQALVFTSIFELLPNGLNS